MYVLQIMEIFLWNMHCRRCAPLDAMNSGTSGMKFCIKLLTVTTIIIIWRCNPLWVFAFSAKSLQVLLSLAVFFQFLIFNIFKSSISSSCHHCLVLPTGLVPIGYQSNSFLVGLAWSILCIWPRRLILCALMNLIMSAPSINLSISMLFRILHILSMLTVPNIFLSTCL